LTQKRWQKVGEVVGAAGTEGSSRSANKKMYNGQEYDYVFDVDIQEGMPPLKLPFNVTDDPWMAAHKFLEENELSPMFLDQVANFITKNTEGVTLGQPQSNFSDPFTGGSRYVPGSSVPSSDPQLNAFQDPFTGGSRYVPGSKSAHSQTTTNNTHDSLTGETRASSNTKESKSTTKSAYFPKTGFLLFESGKPSAVIGKLTEFTLGWSGLEMRRMESTKAPIPSKKSFLLMSSRRSSSLIESKPGNILSVGHLRSLSTIC